MCPKSSSASAFRPERARSSARLRSPAGACAPAHRSIAPTSGSMFGRTPRGRPTRPLFRGRAGGQCTFGKRCVRFFQDPLRRPSVDFGATSLGAGRMEKTPTVTRVPPGWHTVTPPIVVHGPPGLVQFLKRTFNASGDVQTDRPSEIGIGDSVIMISDAGVREAMPSFLYVYVDDVDATYRRALDAGATSVEEPLDMPYGDRRGMVWDAWGNLWQIATHQTAR